MPFGKPFGQRFMKPMSYDEWHEANEEELRRHYSEYVKKWLKENKDAEDS